MPQVSLAVASHAVSSSARGQNNPFNAALDAVATIRENTRLMFSKFGPYVSLIASAQSNGTGPRCAFMQDTAKPLGALRMGLRQVGARNLLTEMTPSH